MLSVCVNGCLVSVSGCFVNGGCLMSEYSSVYGVMSECVLVIYTYA